MKCMCSAFSTIVLYLEAHAVLAKWFGFQGELTMEFIGTRLKISRLDCAFKEIVSLTPNQGEMVRWYIPFTIYDDSTFILTSYPSEQQTTTYQTTEHLALLNLECAEY